MLYQGHEQSPDQSQSQWLHFHALLANNLVTKRQVVHRRPLLRSWLLLYLWRAPHWWNVDQYEHWLPLSSEYRIFWPHSPGAVKIDKDKWLFQAAATAQQTHTMPADKTVMHSSPGCWVLKQSLPTLFALACKFSSLLIPVYWISLNETWWPLSLNSPLKIKN